MILEETSQNEPEQLRVLVVDDEHVIADTLAQIFTLSGFYAIACYGGDEEVAHAKIQAFEVLFTDVLMPGINGIKTAPEVCKLLPGCTVVLTSGNQATAQLLSGAEKCGEKYEIFAKPVHPLVIIDRPRQIRAK